MPVEVFAARDAVHSVVARGVAAPNYTVTIVLMGRSMTLNTVIPVSNHIALIAATKKSQIGVRIAKSVNQA